MIAHYCVDPTPDSFNRSGRFIPVLTSAPKCHPKYVSLSNDEVYSNRPEWPIQQGNET
jgi:hypothetical protein